MSNGKACVLAAAEAAAATGTCSLEEVLPLLRQLSIDLFGEVLLDMPDRRFPALSRLLPAMASAKTQEAWTGSHGRKLLAESVAFVRAMTNAWERFGTRSLGGAAILDYGCGYGRLLRLLMHAADPAHLFGCDPWEAAIELCREARIPCDLKVTPYLPERLPYPDHSVDLAYAFSVFTHTSERASRHALRALHRAVRPGGILVVTIRPVSYWSIHSPLMEGERVTLQAAHDSVGFAFKPHERTPVDGDVTYGDTSLTVETLQRLAPGWLVLHEQILPESPFQRIVYLRAGELPD